MSQGRTAVHEFLIEVRAFLVCALVMFGHFTHAKSTDPLRQVHIPTIRDGVLYIKGPIDSHIYDFLSIEERELKSVHTVDLHSYGGKADWGMEVAQKLANLNLTTRISNDQFCASACVFIFAVGHRRQASVSAWIGIHSAHLSRRQIETLVTLKKLNDQVPFEQFLKAATSEAQKQTQASFALIEQFGTSSKLRETYFSLPDNDDWLERGNVLRKPDWALSSQEARSFNLVTELLP